MADSLSYVALTKLALRIGQGDLMIRSDDTSNLQICMSIIKVVCIVLKEIVFYIYE